LDGVDGIYVEDKSLAVAVHWRRASDQEEATRLISPLIREALETHGLRREPGKFVEELRMPLDEDKGTALRRIMNTRNLRAVAYAGDDRGDLPAFEAVIAAGGHTLVVDGPDIAPEVSRIPGAHFNGPEQFQGWLQQLSVTTQSI
jgi:trehalose 6-phosphate phosphatase